MKQKPSATASVLARIADLLEAAKSIDTEDLETIVQMAHECEIHQIDTPAEPFPVTRQALRMFWLFRQNLDSVPVKSVGG